MTVTFARLTKAEDDTVTAIAQRAARLYEDRDVLSFCMDISATHAKCPLKLDALLAADDFNFAHDIGGIYRHLNRETGELENCFCPRFAA